MPVLACAGLASITRSGRWPCVNMAGTLDAAGHKEEAQAAQVLRSSEESDTAAATTTRTPGRPGGAPVQPGPGAPGGCERLCATGRGVSLQPVRQPGEESMGSACSVASKLRGRPAQTAVAPGSGAPASARTHGMNTSWTRASRAKNFTGPGCRRVEPQGCRGQAFVDQSVRRSEQRLPGSCDSSMDRTPAVRGRSGGSLDGGEGPCAAVPAADGGSSGTRTETRDQPCRELCRGVGGDGVLRDVVVPSPRTSRAPPRPAGSATSAGRTGDASGSQRRTGQRVGGAAGAAHHANFSIPSHPLSPPRSCGGVGDAGGPSAGRLRP